MSQLKLWLEKKLPAEFCYAPGWTSGSMARPKMFPNMQLLDGRLMPSFGLGVYRCLGGFQLGRETGRNIMGRSEIIFEIMCIYIYTDIHLHHYVQTFIYIISSTSSTYLYFVYIRQTVQIHYIYIYDPGLRFPTPPTHPPPM